MGEKEFMELIKIINARKVLECLYDKDDIGSHLSYLMAKFVHKTENENNFFVTEMSKILNKFSEQVGDDKKEIYIPQENVEDFNNAIDALSSTDVEDPGIRFNLSELSKEIKLSMKQIYPLLDFIDEEK